MSVRFLLMMAALLLGCSEDPLDDCDVIIERTAYIEVLGEERPSEVYFIRDGVGGVVRQACYEVFSIPRSAGQAFSCDAGRHSGDYRFFVETGTTTCSYARRIDVPMICEAPEAFSARVEDCKWTFVFNGY